MVRNLCSVCIAVAVFLAPATVLCFPSQAIADVTSRDGTWTVLDVMPADQSAREPWIRAQRFAAARIDLAAMKARLAHAPMEGAPDAPAPLRITLPTPNGGFESFDIVEYSMMEPALAAEFPDIRTYLGQGVDNPASNVHLDLTPLGFHAQVLSPDGGWSIDPYSKGEYTYYTSYYFTDNHREVDWQCHNGPDLDEVAITNNYASRATGTTLRTYRLAMAACPSYTNAFGGSAAQGQAGIVTGVNRVNQVYGNEFAMRFTLVANNQNLVYTSANPGPYTDGNLGTMLGQNHNNCNSVIGSGNYDIGHVLSGLNLGGLANLRALCSTNNKGRGGTGLANPVGDGFWVQYVCHELGHQCGANHTFNADDSASGNVCLPNRNGNTAYEPGSGSTIMSYSHLCGANNQLQQGADPMFNQSSYAEIASHISGSGACSSNTATGNTPPSINAGADRAIPISTPFLVTATGSDVNNDSLTYSWEQRSLGPAQPVSGTGSADNGASPLFRVFLPTVNNFRYFPRLTFVTGGIPSFGEQIPSVGRTMTLRVTARDNRAGGGGVNTDDVVLTVSAAAGPFRVTSPNTNVSWSGPATVTWSVNNTNAAPVNCANVRITMSDNGGQTFNYTLLESTPNTGTANVTLPDINTNLARIKVEAVNNYFYDISDVSFTVTAAPGLASPTNVTANPGVVCPGGSTTLSATVPAGQTVDWYTGGCGTTFIGTGATLNVSPTIATTYRAMARVISSGQTSPACGVTFVTMGTPASISSQPTSATIVEGDMATFSVDAGGSLPLAYQWYFDNNPISDSGAITGSNSPDLTVADASPANAGAYKVVVSNSCGSATSNVATLTINPRCGTSDFNGDGDFGTDADIEAFFACLGGQCCPTCFVGGSDFNGDGDFGTDADIESFFRVLGGGDC